MGLDKGKNIVLFFTDQQRLDSIGVYGNAICQTPNIDGLARGGVRFEQAFTPTAVCSPARASLFTGKYPHRHGLITNTGKRSSIFSRKEIPESETLFSNLLLDSGYQCGYIGKWHLSETRGPTSYGFKGIDVLGYGNPWITEDYCQYLNSQGITGVPEIKHIFSDKLPDSYKTILPNGNRTVNIYARQRQPVEASIPYYLANRIIDLLKEFARKRKTDGTPFFIRCDFWGPHLPYYIPEPYFSRYDQTKIPKFENFGDRFENKPYVHHSYSLDWGVSELQWKIWRKVIAKYWGFVTLIDSQIGRVIDTIKDLNLDDSTAIIFTTDHGSMVGSHQLIDKGPFMYDEIYHIPLIISCPGLVEPNTVSNAFVTLMDLMPTFLGLAGINPPTEIDGKSLIPILSGRTPSDWRQEVFTEFHGHPFFYPQRMIRTEDFKYIFNAPETDEFYDLKRDSHEMRNIVNQKSTLRIQKELQERLLIHMRETHDPFAEWFEMNISSTYERKF